MEKIYRHGDILLKRIDTIPQNVQPTDTNVLAEGEATGHFHKFNTGQVLLFKEENSQLPQFVEVKEEAELIHDEHNTLLIEKGLYAVVREREFNPFTEAEQMVLD